MTYKILSDETQHILHRSEVRSALTPNQGNLRADAEAKPPPSPPDEDPDLPVQKEYDKPMTVIEPNDMIGKTFSFTDPSTDEVQHAQVIEAIDNHHKLFNEQKDRIQYLLSINGGIYEDVMTYNDVLSHVEAPEERLWKFSKIVTHRGPLKPGDPRYKGSMWNLIIRWDNGEETEEPLSIIAADDSVTVAVYAGDNGLLDTPGWKRFKGTYRQHGKTFRSASLARLRSVHTAPKFMYGYEIP